MKVIGFYAINVVARELRPLILLCLWYQLRMNGGVPLLPFIRLHGLGRNIFTFTSKLGIIYFILKVSVYFVPVVGYFWKISFDVSRWYWGVLGRWC